MKWILKRENNDNKLIISVLRAIENIRFEDDEIKLFIKQLNCGEKDIKTCIKNRLINLGPLKLINYLLEILKSENNSEKYEITLLKLIGYELLGINKKVKNLTIQNIGKTKIQEILLKNQDFLVELLTSIFEEDDYQLMKSTLLILKTLGDDIYPIIIKFLKNEDPVIKKNAIILIGKLKIKDAADLLIQNLDSIYEEIAISTIQALGEIGDLSIVPNLLIILDIEASNFEYIDFDMKWYIIEAVKKIYSNNRNPNYEHLYYSLNFNNDILKESVATIMGELGEFEFLNPLLILLNEDNIEIKKSSIIALGKIGQNEAIDPLLDLLNEPDIYWLLKKVIIDSISNIFRKNQHILNNRKNRLRMFFIIRIERIIEYLIDNSDEYYKVKLSIIKFLEEYGEKSAIRVLLKQIADFHRIVRITSTNAIKSIEKRLKRNNS